MEYNVRGNEIEITGVPDFDLKKIFECGQCFRWEAAGSRGGTKQNCISGNDCYAGRGGCTSDKTCLTADEGDVIGEDVYTGVAFGRATRVRRAPLGSDFSHDRKVSAEKCKQRGKKAVLEKYVDAGHKEVDRIFIACSIEDFEATWLNYFDLDRDYSEIRRKLCIDEYMENAARFGAGIRILKQDSWEALCSFIISQCNNIPRIKRIINTLCREFGDILRFDGVDYYSFPGASRLARLEERDLAPLRCGYRAEYIINAARAVASGSLDLSALRSKSYEDARTELTKLRGVGNKVADCTVLFGFNMLDTFPMDVWIKRTIAEQYGPCFDPSVFSPYAGVAQQYIYHYARNYIPLAPLMV